MEKDEFDKQFKRMHLVIFSTWIVSLALGGGALGFAIWGAVKLMQHFKVI